MTTTDAATQDEVQRPTPTLRKRERSEEEVVEESVKDVPASAADEASAPVKKQRQAASMASTPSDKKDASVTDAPSDETTAPASAHVQEHASDATNTEASSAKEAAALATTTSDAKSTEAVSSHEEAPSATNESDKATEGMPEPSAKKSTQPTFSSFASSASPFASSASPFASSKSTSQLGFGAFAARAAPFQSATALSSKAEAAATTEKEKKDWVKDDSESAASPQPEDIVVRKKEVPKPDIERMYLRRANRQSRRAKRTIPLYTLCVPSSTLSLMRRCGKSVAQVLSKSTETRRVIQRVW